MVPVRKVMKLFLSARPAAHHGGNGYTKRVKYPSQKLGVIQIGPTRQHSDFA
jgi:hypothetical protein